MRCQDRGETAASVRGLPCRTVRRQEDAGFTLVEVMIAFVVLLVVMVPLGYLLIAQQASSVLAQQRLAAAGLAETLIEQLSNSTPPSDASGVIKTGVPISKSPPNNTSGSQTAYSFQAEYTWAGSTPNLCASGVPQVLDLEVWAYWDQNKHFVTDNTLINYPPHGVPTLGFLAVQLSNSTTTTDNYSNPYSVPLVPPGQTPQSGVTYRVQSVPVSITGGPTTFTGPLTPDAYGCVFVEVRPGTYTVTLNDPSTHGYGTPPFVANLLDPATNRQPTAPTTSTTVPIGQTSLVQYQYDEATGAVSVSYTVGGIAIPTPTNGIPLTVSNSSLKPSTFWNIVPYTSGPSVTTLPGPGLYPFADGYTIFAGDCGDESTNPGVASVTTAPGGTTSATVPLASESILVEAPLGLLEALIPLLNTSVSLSFTAATPRCPADTYPFLSVTTDSTGHVSAAVPFGIYNITVTATVTLVNLEVTIPAVAITNTPSSLTADLLKL